MLPVHEYILIYPGCWLTWILWYCTALKNLPGGILELLCNAGRQRVVPGAPARHHPAWAHLPPHLYQVFLFPTPTPGTKQSTQFPTPGLCWVTFARGLPREDGHSKNWTMHYCLPMLYIKWESFLFSPSAIGFEFHVSTHTTFLSPHKNFISRKSHYILIFPPFEKKS